MRTDLAIARSLGVSLRRFNGWEPTTVTTTRPDGTTITTRDPEFDAWERSLWIAFDAWEKQYCPGCGTPYERGLWDNDAEPDKRPRWRVGMYRCRPCEVLEQVQSKHVKALEAANHDQPVPTHHLKWFAFEHPEGRP